MSYCIKCGRKNESSDKFCIKCGNPLHIHLSATGALQIPIEPSSPETQRGIKSLTAHADFNAGIWFSKNKIYVLSATVILCVVWAVNYFFFKSHPDKDGKAAANAECACEEKRTNDFVNKKNEFLQNFDTYHFSNAYEARQKLDSFNSSIGQQYNTCIQQARLWHNKKAENYSADYNSLEVFNEQYNTQKQLCNSESEDLKKVTEDIGNKLSHFSPYIAPSVQPMAGTSNESVNTERNGTKSLQKTDLDNGILTDEFIRNQIAGLYNQENNIGLSPDDINKLMAYYEFPMERYYDARNVDASRLSKIYSDSYFKSLSYHHVKDFENKMTISRQTDGSVKVIVGCTFEFSTNQSPGDKRSRNAFNVYILTKNGQVKSVYQLL